MSSFFISIFEIIFQFGYCFRILFFDKKILDLIVIRCLIAVKQIRLANLIITDILINLQKSLVLKHLQVTKTRNLILFTF